MAAVPTARDGAELHISATQSLRVARTHLIECLGRFQSSRTTGNAFELLESAILLESIGARRTIPFACFEGSDSASSTSDAKIHYVMGDEALDYRVVPIARHEEPLYWSIDRLAEASTDPFFEEDAEDLYAAIERRAHKALGE